MALVCLQMVETMNELAVLPIAPGRRTDTAEAARMLCYGVRIGWKGWGVYLAQCDMFNRVPK